MKMLLSGVFMLFTISSLFSQARFNIFNGAYASMGGGSSGSPIYMVMDNGNANAFSRTGSGHIISENEYHKVKWNIGTNTGVYEFHYGKNTTDYIPFYLNKTASGFCPTSPCSFTVSTWYSLNNATMPSGVTAMCPSENSAIDRFWVINLSGYTANPASDVRFYYNTAELDGISESVLKAQRWNASLSPSCKWENPTLGTVNTVSKYVEVTGVSQFSPWTLVDDGNPLPIELLSLTAEWADKTQAASLLKWETGTELNNAYFEVQRSADAFNFDSIGVVQGTGNSSSYLRYHYIDYLKGRGDSSETFYYRLKQVDYDGASSYSKIVTINRNTDFQTVSIFPNPADDYVHIQLYSPENNKGEVIITNALSQVIVSEMVRINKGNNVYSYSTQSLSPGICSIKIITDQKTTIDKILISR